MSSDALYSGFETTADFNGRHDQNTERDQGENQDGPGSSSRTMHISFCGD
jgi:hypothetical protein